MSEKEVGKITHYFDKIQVGIIEVTKGSIKAGDVLRIKGNTTDLLQNASSMQIDRKPIKEAKKGQKIGIKVDERVKEGDLVFKVAE